MATGTVIPVVPANYQSSTTILQTTAADSTDGMTFVNNGITVLFVNNASEDAVTVDVISVPDAAGRGGSSCDNLSVSVGAGAVCMFGPFTPAWWNQTTAATQSPPTPDSVPGSISVTFSASSDISAYAVQIA